MPHIMLFGILLRVGIYVPYVLGVVYLVNIGVTDHRLAIIMGVATPSVAALEAAIRRFEGMPGGEAKDPPPAQPRSSNGKFTKKGE